VLTDVLLFAEEHIKKIRAGEKTVTRRDWDPNYNRPREGVVHGASTEMFQTRQEVHCWIRIETVRQERLGNMRPADARAEGGYSLPEFQALWKDLNGWWDPDAVVDVVEFDYAGWEPPEKQRAAEMRRPD